jgi:hypothetical protein
VLGQAVLDLNPRHFGANKDVKLGAHTGVVIEKTSWNAHNGEIRRLSWDSGAAHTAKVAKAPGCRLEALDQIFSRNQAKLVGVDMHITRHMSTAQLTAIAAVAVSQQSRRVDLKSNSSAKAASFDHTRSPLSFCPERHIRDSPHGWRRLTRRVCAIFHNWHVFWHDRRFSYPRSVKRDVVVRRGENYTIAYVRLGPNNGHLWIRSPKCSVESFVRRNKAECVINSVKLGSRPPGGG